MSTTTDVGRWAAEIEPRRYQTNASLSQPPTKAAERPVREYVTNVSRRASSGMRGDSDQRAESGHTIVGCTV